VKICITTTFDRNYTLAGRTLFKSIRRHTDCTGIDFKVITSDPEVVREFGAENCHVVTDEIKARYANVKDHPQNPLNRFSHSLYRYEMFSFENYDRVVLIDADCLCPADISYLFSEDLSSYDLISVEDYIVSRHWGLHNLPEFIAVAGSGGKGRPELHEKGLNMLNLRQRMLDGKIDVQASILVANKNIVNRAWYDRLLHYANTTEYTYALEMGILNDFIYQDGLKIKLLPVEWNYQDCYEIYVTSIPVPAHPRMVHCQQSKPFKNERSALPECLRKWHDLWWEECNH